MSSMHDLRCIATEAACLRLDDTDDPRVGECINTVRAYLCGMADDDDLAAAYTAADAAAHDAVPDHKACRAACAAAWPANPAPWQERHRASVLAALTAAATLSGDDNPSVVSEVGDTKT